MASNPIHSFLKTHAQPLRGEKDLDELAYQLRSKKVVMLGEATHGTSEFYSRRAELSLKLIKDYGFKFIAIEGDFPDSQRINNWLKGQTSHGSALQVLLENHRWPTWMWANSEFGVFLEQIKGSEIQFVGLDIYSLFESLEASAGYIKKNFPKLKNLALELSDCFEPFEKNERAYSRSLIHYPQGCLKELTSFLKETFEMRMRQGEFKNSFEEAYLNAKVAANAERYYRSLIFREEESWNIRDQHMMDTLEYFSDRFGPGIIWAHNTHIGDYRATPMESLGLINLGGLARQHFGPEYVSLIGFGTYQGSVIAATQWGSPEQVMEVPKAHKGSLEGILHEFSKAEDVNQFYFDASQKGREVFDGEWPHRAIGVVYNLPERRGQYVPTRVSSRYDHFVFIDRSSALHPLGVERIDAHYPETFPSGV